MFDGAGDVVPDAMVETWQADPDGRFDHRPRTRAAPSSYPGFRGYAPVRRRSTGEFGVRTLKPGRVPDGEGGLQAPHIDVSVFARGHPRPGRHPHLLRRRGRGQRRGRRPAVGCRRSVATTLLADAATDDGYRFDVHLQGDRETVFFAV